jgi:hypothetical protein
MEGLESFVATGKGGAMRSRPLLWTSRIVSLGFVLSIVPYLISSCFLNGPEFIEGGVVAWVVVNIPRIALAIFLVLFWNKEEKFDLWAPRVLLFSILLVLSMFSLDVFDGHSGFWEILFGLFMHNLPWLIVLVLFVVFRKHVLVVGTASLLAGLIVMALMLGAQSRGHGDPHLLFGMLLLPGPALMSGFLFVVSGFKHEALE